MENIQAFLEELKLDNKIKLEDIPTIDLYMDQVIQLFDHSFSNGKEKTLTKTMINNYAKAKLFFSVQNKKYTKEHIILMSLIYQLKGTLSINDIKATLKGINEKTVEEAFDLEQFYSAYLGIVDQNVDRFKEDVSERVKEVSQVIGEDTKDSKLIHNTLLIASLSHISTLYKNAAEKLVREMEED
ncbi:MULTISPECIES: DUF1836 domain-containing protein [Sutcliffiella]|uniref:DUF1836 domain-containing protein n=1 Tax=Sutcliffiella cohnii TaxID=33932 RepID=A0A223KK39_9BACI|nr:MULTISPECIES: DUF1836 domain-containing protein [Sutcliffiella]AST89851.1 hypothetical protein BC6307_00450 [Sutcliffiella cohnii]MED4018206.1 DUF1836 domain-containing protein [Sutcliffiella cohnii]WBL15478.1 DUF1836 domain-containing protein [Sutcliffiella sp. NC1]